MSTPTTLYADLPERLKVAADTARDAATASKNSVKRRNQLIVAAVDQAGMTQGAVAKATNLTQPTINRILALHGDADDLVELDEENAA